MVYAAEFREFRKGSRIRNSLYLQMLYVVDRIKNKSFTKIYPLTLKICGISSHQKSRNSAEFDEFRNTEYAEKNIRNSENTLG
jgi:hypothetical protein